MAVRAHRKRQGSSARSCRNGRARLQITPENVAAVVTVVGDQIAGLADKSHIAPSRTDGRRRRGGVAPGPIGAHAGQLGRPVLQIAHVDVIGAICLVRRKIIRVAHERDEAAIGTDGGAAGETVGAARARAVHADQKVRAGLQVADEHVLVSIGVVRHEIVRPTRENYEPPVRAQGIGADGTQPVSGQQLQRWRGL